MVVLFVRFNTGSSDLAFVGGPFRTICFYVDNLNSEVGGLSLQPVCCSTAS